LMEKQIDMSDAALKLKEMDEKIDKAIDHHDKLIRRTANDLDGTSWDRFPFNGVFYNVVQYKALSWVPSAYLVSFDHPLLTFHKPTHVDLTRNCR